MATHRIIKRRHNIKYFRIKPGTGEELHFNKLNQYLKDGFEGVKREWYANSEESKIKIMQEYMGGLSKPDQRTFKNRYFDRTGTVPEIDKFDEEIMARGEYAFDKIDVKGVEDKILRKMAYNRNQAEIDSSLNAAPGLKKEFWKTLASSVGKAIGPREFMSKLTKSKLQVGKSGWSKTDLRVVREWGRKHFSKPVDESTAIRAIYEDPESFKETLVSYASQNDANLGIAKRLNKKLFNEELDDREIKNIRAESRDIGVRDKASGIYPEIAKRVSAILGYGQPSQWKSQPVTQAIALKIQDQVSINGQAASDPEIEKAIHGVGVLSYDEIKRRAPPSSKITTNKISKYTDQFGIDLVGFSELETKARGRKKTSKWPGIFGSSSRARGASSGYKGGGSYGGYGGGGRGTTTKPYFSTTDVTVSKGIPKLKTKEGRIGQWFGRQKEKFTGAGRYKSSEKKAEDRTKLFLKKYGEIYPEHRAKGVMKRGGLFSRVKARWDARRMAVDPTYAMKKYQQWEIEEGIAKAKMIRTKKEVERMQRAAVSPYYSAFYRFSKYTKWIAIAALTIAILFIPVGMFYVLGWALAVAIIALFQFLVWIFMELWFMLAQAVVSIVGLVGQAFIFIINFLGRTIAGPLGQSYQDFNYQAVSNMLMFEKDAAGNWVVYSYTDVAGKKQLLTWGALNLTPPSFLNLELFKPTTFDTNTLAGYILPPIRDFFAWLYTPIAQRYTGWMSDPTVEWYFPGIIIGVPALIIIIAVILIVRHFRRRVYA